MVLPYALLLPTDLMTHKQLSVQQMQVSTMKPYDKPTEAMGAQSRNSGVVQLLPLTMTERGCGRNTSTVAAIMRARKVMTARQLQQYMMLWHREESSPLQHWIHRQSIAMKRTIPIRAMVVPLAATRGEHWMGPAPI